jgi:hypothetical protein
MLHQPRKFDKINLKYGELIVRWLQKGSLALGQDVLRLGNTTLAFRLLKSKYQKSHFIYVFLVC